jgi:tetratricopeptide (TPR) repeat protein
VNESQVFLAAVKLTSPAARAAYVDAACAGDGQLRAAVEALLRAHDTDPAFLEHPAAETADLFLDEVRPAGPGLVLAGRYELLEQLGEGGMGTVWMARQSVPVTRAVAVKLIRPGMDSDTVLARFEAERQALALMDHPNIAKVLDAGATPDGRPFFVMELVRGSPITAYCDEHRLTPRQRLELFLSVGSAIQHAHQKGVIHRDVKPSNVLVAVYDDGPVPKVIDFGVAKAVGRSPTGASLHTGFGAVVGTPQYMSPEQATFDNPDVDTRSDVYSLGVLLYELLAGSPPFVRGGPPGADVLEVLRAVREDEPPPPSTRVGTADALPALADRRGTDPRSLCGLLRGELDWVVMKAIEKDPGGRYETAGAFAADVRRYLADEPVVAGPPSAAYRLRKFVRRNKGAVTATGFVALALLAGIAGTAWQAVRADGQRLAVTRERDEKQKALDSERAARRQAMDALRTMTDEFVISRQLGRQIGLSAADRDVLVNMVGHFEAFAALTGDTPESRAIRAEGLYRVGVLRHRLGDRAEALAAYGRAGKLYQQLADEFPDVSEYRGSLAMNQNHLALLFQDLGRTDEAEAAFRRAIGLITPDAFPTPRHYRENLAACYTNLAIVLDTRKLFPAAEHEFRLALAVRQQLADAYPNSSVYRRQLAAAHRNLGGFLWQFRRPEAADEHRLAIGLLAPLIDRFPRTPEYRRDAALAHADLGLVLRQQGERAGAEAEYRLALAALQRLAADYPGVPVYRRDLAVQHQHLAILLAEWGNPLGAESEYRRAIALQKQLADDFPDVPGFRLDLAGSHTSLGHLLDPLAKGGDAGAEFRRAITLLKPQTAGSNSPDNRLALANAHGGLGFFLLKRRKYADAEPELQSGLTILRSLADEFPGIVDYTVELGGAYSNRATLLRDTGKAGEALGVYKQAADVLTPVVDRDPRQVTARRYLANIEASRAQALDQLRRHTDADTVYRRAAELFRHLAADCPDEPQYRKSLADTHHLLASLLDRCGKTESAVTEFNTAITLLQLLVKDYPAAVDHRRKLAWWQNELGAVLPKVKKLPEAAAEFRRAIAVQYRLVADRPDDPEYRADLADSYSNLGFALMRLGADEAAEAELRRALTIQKSLVEKFPQSPRYRMGQAKTHNSLGIVFTNLRRAGSAESEYRAALALQKQLVADFPNVPDYVVDLAGTSCNYGTLVRTRNAAEALDLYRQAVKLLTPLAERQPPHATARLFLSNSHGGRAETLTGLARFAEAIPEWDRALELDDGTRRPAFELQRAWCLAHVDPPAAVAAVGRLVEDGKLSAERVYSAARVAAAASGRTKDRAEGGKYAGRAVLLLRQAREKGYFKDAARVSVLVKDPAFDPLRGREDFKALVLDLEGSRD